MSNSPRRKAIKAAQLKRKQLSRFDYAEFFAEARRRLAEIHARIALAQQSTEPLIARLPSCWQYTFSIELPRFIAAGLRYNAEIAQGLGGLEAAINEVASVHLDPPGAGC